MQILITLRQLGLAVDESKANKNGDIMVKAPFRSEKVASLSINLESGLWFDYGTDEGGTIYQLVMKIMNLTFPEAKDFVDGKGASKTMKVKKPSYHLGYNHPFWTEAQKQLLKEAHTRLKNAEKSPLLKMVESYDGIKKETLNTFDCGIIDWNFGGERKEALLIPYPSGAQVYTRGTEGKQMAMLKGSKPSESFIGTNQLSRKKELIIAKSPREAMLLFQDLGATFDVFGSCSGENDKLHDKQVALLTDKARYWNGVFICRDRDTILAEKLAFGFARKVCDAIGDFKRDIRLCNLGKLTGNQCKDVTDLLKSEHSSRLLELFTPSFSDYVWNSLTHENKFWDINEKGVLDINEVRFVKVFGRYGIKKSYFGESEEPTLVRDIDNILTNVSSHQLNDLVLDELMSKFSKYVDQVKSKVVTKTEEKLIHISRLQKVYFKYRDKILSNQIKAIFRTKKLSILTDDPTAGYLFFGNGVAKVTMDGLELLDFAQLKGKIWKSQIMGRTFTETSPEGTGDLERFVENVAGSNSESKRSFMSALGYLLHTYKNKTNSPAIILVDEKSSPGIAQGGTGKSLFAQSIKHTRAQRYMAGKNVDPSSRFFFMDAQLGDQSLFFDDVRHDFDFEALFNVITDDMQVEAKYANRITIPFEVSPKIIIATNSVITGQGNSYDRRQFILEFSPYYVRKKPEIEFGKKLYHDWNEVEWNRFDHFMIGCIQKFLKNGLKHSVSESYAKNKIKSNTSHGLVEWAESWLNKGEKYSINVLFDGASKFFFNPDLAQLVQMKPTGIGFVPFLDSSYGELQDSQIKTFVKWLEQFAIYKGWRLNELKHHGYKVVMFN